MFAEGPRTGLMDDPVRLVVWLHTWITTIPIPDDEVRRAIQEFSCWSMESPAELTGYLRELLEMTPR